MSSLDLKELKSIMRYALRPKHRESIARRLLETEYHNEAKGEPNAPQVLIVQRQSRSAGTFSDYITFLHYIERAVERNWIPVIDRKTVKSVFMRTLGDCNTWECFFDQPCGLTLDGIDYSKMRVNCCVTSSLGSVSLMRCQNADTIAYWRKIAKQYIRFNERIQKHLDAQKETLLKDKRVLGASVREGYTKLFQSNEGWTHGHALQLPTDTLIEKLRLLMKEWNCDYVFVACQTEDTLNQFKEAFGEKLIYYPRSRTSYEALPEGKSKEAVEGILGRDQYQNELDYISEVYLLSNCTSFVCSNNSGSEAAFIMSDGFEHFICFENGVF